jgi:hypothetical protein
MKSFHQFSEDIDERRQQLAQKQRDNAAAFTDRAKTNMQKQAATRTLIKQRYEAMQKEREDRLEAEKERRLNRKNRVT